MPRQQNVTAKVNGSAGSEHIINDEEVLAGKVARSEAEGFSRIFYPFVACTFRLGAFEGYPLQRIGVHRPTLPQSSPPDYTPARAAV